MANRYPLILNTAAGQLQELPSGDSLDLGGESILGVGNLTVGGDFTVSGTTTNINTVNLLVEDKNIVMGDVASPTNITADGGGITLKGVTDKTISWVNATAAWTFSEHVNIASAKEYRIAGTKVLDATGLGSAVVSSSLTSVGTIGTGVWNGSVIGKAYLDATVVSTGDTGTVTSTMLLNGTVLDADVNASAAIAGTKISPNFGSQAILTTGTNTAASFSPTSNTAPTNGVYLPAANSVAISTNGAQRLSIGSTGHIGNLRSIATAFSGTNAATWTNGLSLTNIATPGVGVSNLIVFEGISNVNSVFGVTQAGSSYGDFVWAASAGTTSERMRLTAGGQLGIGTTAPQTLLQVGDSTTGNGVPKIRVHRGAGTDYFQIDCDAGQTTLDTVGGGPFRISIGSSPAFMIDPSRRLLVGTSNNDSNFDSKFQIASGDATASSLLTRFSANAGGPVIYFGKSRSADVGTKLLVDDGDTLGGLEFYGSGAANWQLSAKIEAQVDGTPESGGDTSDMPGRLVFSTTANGASSPTERMRITSSGAVRIGSAISITPYDSLSSGTLSFEGSAGQLFSITNNLTSGSIFSVNDVSGIPSIDVDANGTIQLGAYGGKVLVGTATSAGSALLQVNGDSIRVGTAKTPGASSSTGVVGEIAWDANYIYVCTTTNTWKRVAISTW